MATFQPPIKQQRETIIYGINGMDLSHDSQIAGTQRMLEVVDFDLHIEDGAAVRRRPFLSVGGVGATAHNTMVTEFSGVVYLGKSDGSIYANFNSSSFDTGYGETITTGRYQDANGVTNLYLASDKKMQRLYNGEIKPWGLEPPLQPIVEAKDNTTPTTLTGTYGVVMTAVEKIGGVVINESNPTEAIYVTVNSGIIKVTFRTYPDVGATHIRIYRTEAGGTTFLLDQEFGRSSGTRNLSQSDADLGAAVEQDNDPPIKSNIFAIYRDRGWLSDGIDVFYSEKFNLHAWPALNFFTIGTDDDPVISIVGSEYGLAVFTRKRRLRIMESLEDVQAIGSDLPFFGGSSTSFIPIVSSNNRGTLGLKSAISIPEGIVFAASDGIFLTRLGVNDDQNIGTDIRGIFFNRGTSDTKYINADVAFMSTMLYHESKLYFSYPEYDSAINNNTLLLSLLNQKWYQYDLSISDGYSSQESNRLLVCNSSDGVVYNIDDYGESSSTNVSAHLLTHHLNFDMPFIRKILHYIYVDVDMGSDDTLAGTLYIDGVEDISFTVSTRKKVRFPAGKFGHDFQIDLSYSSSNLVKIRGMRLGWTPLLMV